MDIVEKVVAYVVGPESQLLVFTHKNDMNPVDESGLQVPAGTIEEGETPEEAVIREVYEESGLEVEVIEYLGVEDYDMRPYKNELHRRHFFRLKVKAGSILKKSWTHVESSSDGDTTYDFYFYWLPLERCHVLSAGQAAKIGLIVI